MKKILLVFQLTKNMGLYYVLFRLIFEIKRKSGLLAKKFPVNPQPRTYLTLLQWKCENKIYLIGGKADWSIEKKPDPLLRGKAVRILAGQLPYFNSHWIKVDHQQPWHFNPDSGFTYATNVHWTKIPDLSPETGDIKFVWEKSRFSYLYTIVADDYHNDKDHSEWVMCLIIDWIEANPVNCGPNWRCSQEISLRLFNWLYVLHYYTNSPALTEYRFARIMESIYWHLHHVYQNIHFSRIAVRNNHAITETAALMLSEILFPYFPESKKWGRKGRCWFLQEIKYQCYADGSYLQFSMNYQRVVIQLFTLSLRITELANKELPEWVYQRAYLSLDFLYQAQAGNGGELPNYGANDGALFFPFSWYHDYRDYRPQLNSLHFLLTGKDLYNSNEVKMDRLQWGMIDSIGIKRPVLEKRLGWSEYPVGGFYIYNEVDTMMFIRCGGHKDRPSHADNLHLDVWYKGENILRDSGTYKYNADYELVKYFAGSCGHNTLMINGHDQMIKGPRFIWLNWTQALQVDFREEAGEIHFLGEIKAFGQLGKIVHQRRIQKKLGSTQWKITDTIRGVTGVLLQQNWHVDPKTENWLIFKSQGKIKHSNGWYSSCYGSKVQTKIISFESNENQIETCITLKQIEK